MGRASSFARDACGTWPRNGDTTVALATYPDHPGGPSSVVVLSPGFAVGVTTYGWLAAVAGNSDTGTLLAPPDQPPSLQVTYRAEGY